jgi:hypothetical protein
VTVRARELDSWAWVLGVGNDDDGLRVVDQLLASLLEHIDGVQRIVDRLGQCPGDVPGLLARGVGVLGAAGDDLVDVAEAFALHARGDR